MTDEQLQQFQAALDAWQTIREALAQIAGDVLRALTRWYWKYMHPILRALGFVPSHRHPQTTRKIRRMLLYRAAVGQRGTIRRRGSNAPILFDPLLN